MMYKNLISFLLIAFVITSCGSKTENTASTEDYGDPKTESATIKASEDLVAQGAALVKKNDCNTCHHSTNALVGPSHTDVAKKYEFTNDNIEMLADRITKGGSGVWGQVMMTPHPDLSRPDALKMARYVLSLDGEKEPE